MPRYNYSTNKWEKTKEEEEEERQQQLAEQQKLIEQEYNEKLNEYYKQMQAKEAENIIRGSLKEANPVQITKDVATGLYKAGKSFATNLFKTPEELKDGFDLMDIPKIAFGTGGKVATEFTRGLLNIGEGIGDTINYGVADVADFFGADEFANNLRAETKKDLFNNYLKPNDEIYGKNSITGSSTDTLVNSLGYIYGLQATAGLGKTKGAQTLISTAVTFNSAYGHAMSEAYQNGATADEARKYALIDATAEAGSELLFGGLGKGSNAVGLSSGVGGLDDQAINYLTRNFKHQFTKNLTQMALKQTGEGLEEIISGYFSAWGKKLTYMKDEDFNKILKDEKLGEQFISAFVSSGISSAPGFVRTTSAGQDYLTGRTAGEQQIYDKMVETKTNEKIAEKNNQLKQKAINEKVKEVIAEKQEKFKNAKIDEKTIRAEVAKNIEFDDSTTQLTKKEISDINESVDEAFEKGKLNFNDIYDTFTPEETNKLTRLDKELSNLDLNDELRKQYEQEFESTLQQREEKINKIAEDNAFVRSTLYNEKLRHSNFELTKEEQKLVDGNKDLKNLYDDAVKYGNNSEEAHRFFHALAKMSTQTEYQYRLTNSEELEQLGYNVNKKYKVSTGDTLESIANKYKISTEDIKKANNLTGNNINVGQELIIPNKSAIINGLHDGDNKTIYINMDSDNALNIIVGHETGHIFENTPEYKELQKMLFEVAEADGTLADRRAELESLYENVKNAKIDVELTNDLLGEKLFTDEKFIERLAQKPNLFTKIKDKIDDLVIKFKGTEEEKKLREIQNKFLEVYRRNNLQEYVAEADAQAKKEKGADYSLSKKFTSDDLNKYKMYSGEVSEPIELGTIKLPNGDKINITSQEINTGYETIRKIIGTKDNGTKAILSFTKKGVPTDNYDYKNDRVIYDYDTYVIKHLEGAEKNDKSGTTLLNELIKEAKDNNIKSIIADDTSHNFDGRPSSDYWEKMGFVADDKNNHVLNLKENNTKYSLSAKDNKGRTLTTEEQQKLRNSKARDEDGRLMELYHGTRHNFDEFTIGSGEHGDGFYFTEDSNYANEFADDENGRVIKAYLNLENPLSKNIDINDEATKKFINEIENKWGLSESEIIKCFNSEDWSSDLGAKVAEKMGYGKQDVENTLGFEIDSPEDFGITDYNAYLGAYAWNNGLNDLVRESGFDGIISRTYNSTSEDYEYIAFNNNQIVQIKDKNNLTPIKTNNLNEYIADVSAREAKQNALDKESVRQSIMDYLEENNITNPTKEDMMNAFDDYDVMDNSDTLNDANKAEKLYSEVADEILKENNSKYSLSVKEANTGKDNDGNKLSKGQMEKFADSKITDENGNLIKVYHTTTDKIVQFNEFNPVGTPYYRFGDQVVNFFTDSQDMSGSYANQDYEVADTRLISSDNEVNDLIYNNNYNESNTKVLLQKNEDNSYTLYIKSLNDINNLVEGLKSKYDENVLGEIAEWLNKPETTLDEYIQQQPYPLPDKIVTEMRNISESFGLEDLPNMDDWYSEENKEMLKFRNGLRDILSETKYTEDSDKEMNRGVFKKYKTKEDLYKNIKQDLNKLNGVEKNYQYQGYLNITNPYIVDAEKRNWNQVVSQSNEFIDELEERVPEDVKNNLTRLYNESSEKSNELRDNYMKYQTYLYDIDTNLKYSKHTKAMNHLIRRLGIDDVTALSYGQNISVSGWYSLADTLQQDGIIDEKTSKEIIDDFKIPDSLKEWIDRELYGEQDFKGGINLKELYDNYKKAYNDFDEYRMPSTYFIEQISKEGNDYLGNELEDIFETRAEIKGAEAVAEELAEASSVAFSKPAMIKLWGTSKTTNDIVSEILQSNKDGKTNYDGIVVENVYDYGGKSNEGEKDSHNIYVTFNSNQFKSADNKAPTDDADIRYSISKKGKLVDNKGNDVRLDVSDVGNTGTLMAMHNLNAEKLNGIIDLGGFPVPSIAITTTENVGSNQFGNISVLFNKDTIDPANRLNEVYDRDVWTPTFPKVEYDIDNEMIRKMSKNNHIYDDNDDGIISHARLNYMYSDNLTDLIDRRGLAGTLDKMKDDNELKYLYLKTKDNDYKPQMKPKKYSDDYTNRTLQNFIDNFKWGEMELPDFYYHYLNYGDMDLTDDQRKALKMSVRDAILPEIKQEAKEEYKKAFEKNKNGKLSENDFVEKYINMMLENFDGSYFKYKDFIRDASRLYEFGETETIDENKTLEQVNKDINQKEYEKWVDDTFGNMIKSATKGIRNDKDLFTASGNRRSFNQLHEKYDLENIVKYMTSQKTIAGEKGFGAGSGFGTIQAQMSNRFNTLDDIRNSAKEKIVPNTQEQDLIKPYSEKIYNDMEELIEYYKYKNEKYSYPMDSVGYALNDYAGLKKHDITNLKKILNEYQFETDKIPEKILNKVVDDINSLKNIPTDYFEAKPQRAVGLDEIQSVVLPTSTDESLKNKLKELNIDYVEYNPEIEGDKQRVINQFDNLKFSLSRKNNLAPIRGDYQVYSKDIRNNNLAPIREDITKKPASKNVNYSLLGEPEEINPLEDRNMDEVGKRDVKAYQYENPEVKPYYQEMARYMMSDLDNSVRGERYATDDLDYLGTSRQTTDDIAYLLDEYNYSYDDIKKGLNAIIQDHGAENIAVAKRLEILINERLLNGYTDSLGYEIPANQEYIDLVKSEAPAESEVDYSAFDAMLPVKNELERLSKRDEEKYRKKREKYQEQINRAKKVSKQNKSELKRNWDNFKTLFVNENNEIDNLAKDSGNKKLTYKADMLNNYVVEAENDINNYQTDYNGKEIGKSVKQLFEPAKEQGLYEAFNDYLINYSNIDRHKYGKGSLRWETTSQRLIDEYEEKYPQFKEWGKDVWQYGKNALNTMEQSGLIDKTLKNKLNKMYPHYVPFMDNADLNMYIGANDEIVPKKTIKNAKGGMSTTEILPMEDALTRYAYSYRKSMRQNDLYSEIVRTLRGNEITDTGAGDTRQEVTDLKESLYKDENGNYLKAYIDGDTKVISISNDLYRALKNDLKYQIKDLEDRLSLITKPLQKATKIKGNLVTSWSPSFIGKNFFKDFQDAMFNSTDTKKFLKYYPSAFNELRKNDTELVRQFRAMYGSAVGQYTGSDTGAMKQATKTKNPFKKFANANEIIELAPRYAEFKASLENGATIEEAMYNAREVTTNFSRGGTITKAINRNGFNFVNASTQGLSKFIRNFTGQNGVKGFTHALVKAVEFGIAPALFNELVFGSGEDKDEDYDALPDYVKDNYYLFKYDDNKFIRIPKGRALSVFGSGARRTLEYMNGEKDAFDGYLTNTWNQIGINNPEESFLLTPLMQAKNNKTWYGGDIVPTRLQDKPAGEQSDEKTDLFSKWLGEHLNISPKKINYVIDQYSGGIGDMVLPFITPEAQSEYDNPLARALAPIRDQFVVNSIDDNKYVSDFYTNNDKLKVQANSEYATDEDALRYKYSNAVSSELATLYKEKRLIQNDSSLSNSEKYKKAQAIKQQINEIAKEGLENYGKVSIVGNYAEVNDREYYRNNKNEWTKAKEEDIEEMNKLGLTAREKNNYYNSKNTISTITTKYKNLSAKASEEEKDQLSVMKKSEIINTIKATNITNDAKAYLYGKYYSSDEKMNVITTLDIDMDKYLDFELQDFKSDKDATGKTIRNSKKNKMLKYINSMDGTYGEKLIIYKLNNMTDDSYNREIINYLNSQNLSQEEKRTILKALGMKIDNAGNVRW